MSIVRAKNAIVKRIMANLPQGLTAIDAKAEHRQIAIYLTGSTVDVLKPGLIKIETGRLTSYEVAIMAKRGDDDYSYTKEADEIEDAVKALITDELRQGFRVCTYWDSRAFRLQAQRMAGEPVSAPGDHAHV